MLEKNPITIKIHHDITLKYLLFSINSHNLSLTSITSIYYGLYIKNQVSLLVAC